MTLDIRSFFIGIATVGAILAVGFGGGVLMGGVISGSGKTPNKLERQAAIEPKLEPTKVEPAKVEPVKVEAVKPEPVRIEPKIVPQAANEKAANDLKELKAALPPVVTPWAQATATPVAAPAETEVTAQTPPAQATAAPPAAVAPTVTAQTPAPALGPQRQVSLPQPSAEPRGLSRREEARLRAQQRHEERAQRREERRKLIAERRLQELARRDELRARQPQRQDVDDDDNADERPIVRPRGLFFGGPFGLFR